MAKNRLDFQAHLSRHAHDISAGYAASLAPGGIIPQFFDIASPGDAYYFQTRLFARLQDVVTAFLGEVDLHVDYFFVPLQMLYTPFGQIFAQTDDYLTSLYNPQQATDLFPTYRITEALRRAGNSGHYLGHKECVGKESMRLLDALDFNPLYCVGHDVRVDVEHSDIDFTWYDDSAHMLDNVAAWIPAAYQAIYQKYYRNDEFERFDVRSYNFDQFYADQSTFYSPDFIKLRYVQRPSDYFTETRPSPLASAVNKFGRNPSSDTDRFPSEAGKLNYLLNQVNDWLSPRSENYSYIGRFGQDFTMGDVGDDHYGELDSFKALSVSNPDVEYQSASSIRTLFAIDKFQRIYGRADKTYDDQILAHFGIKIPHDVKHDITHIKHYHAVIQSDPIYSMANVQNTQDSNELVSSLGQVGGQGSCDLNSGQEKFVAPVHGVFMCVAYAVTKPRYVGTFSKLHELNSRIKFPIPEFDKLGAQPLFYHEFDPHYFFRNPESEPEQNWRMARAGWQNRYQEFKKKYNRASIVYWGDNVSTASEGGFIPKLYLNNVYSPWVLSRPAFEPIIGVEGSSFPVGESSLLSTWRFFERPDALDTIMVNTFRPDWDNDWYTAPHLVFQSDPILTDFYCKCKKVSWMSETGEPDL